MIAALKSEFRKIFTVRSTYVIFAAAFLVSVGLVGFWIYGFKNVGNLGQTPGAITDMLYIAMTFLGLLFSFLAILLVGHEYRYNTIMYSLTSANRRAKVFLAKYISVSLVTLTVTALLVLGMVAAFYIGQSIHGYSPVAQNVPIWSVSWRVGVMVLGTVSFAFIAISLLRNLIGTIAIVLILPTTVEGLLGIVLKENVKYLPYTALGTATSRSTAEVQGGLITVAAYVVILGVVSLFLFVKRDAN